MLNLIEISRLLSHKFHVTENLIFYGIFSSLVCCLGILYDSNSTVLGSMLVSPFPIPVLAGINNLLKGNNKELFKNFKSFIFLWFIVYVSAFIIGFLNEFTGYFKLPTKQMNSFTKMTRIATELLTSALGGGIISYAEEIDDYVSMAGVSLILTMLPPLVNGGLLHGIYFYEHINNTIKIINKEEEITKKKDIVKKGNTSLLMSAINIAFTFLGGLIIKHQIRQGRLVNM